MTPWGIITSQVVQKFMSHRSNRQRWNAVCTDIQKATFVTELVTGSYRSSRFAATLCPSHCRLQGNDHGQTRHKALPSSHPISRHVVHCKALKTRVPCISPQNVTPAHSQRPRKPVLGHRLAPQAPAAQIFTPAQRSNPKSKLLQT